MATNILGLVVLILDILALVKLWGGPGGTDHKILWTLAIVLLPLLGMILYFAIGQKSAA